MLKQASAISITRNIAAAFFGLILSAMVIHHFLPPPHISEISRKLAYIRAHQNEFDTLFVGSSRFYHQIIPKEFDAEMAAAGHPTNSFNLGIDAMFPPESFYYLRQVLAAHPGKIKWVFFELMPLAERGAVYKGAPTKRLIYSRNLPDTWLSLRIIAAAKFEQNKKISRIKRYALTAKVQTTKVPKYMRLLNLFFHHEFNTGRLSDSLITIFHSKKTDSRPFWSRPFWIGHRGCYAVDATVTPAVRKKLIDGVGQFKKNQPKHVQPSPILISGLQRVAREIRAAGATPVFIAVQSLDHKEYFDDIRKHGLNVKVFSFHNPTKYPTLYEPKMYFDFKHLNKTGATIFTRDLANQFAQWLDTSEKTTRNPR